MAVAIKVENLSKAYQLGEIGTGSLNRDLERWLAKVRGKEDPFLKIGETNDRTSKGNSDVVWSLKDIHFTIEQGDAVGIVGRNGAGKSTLLKLLSRVTSPTTGRIRVKGRIASLLEVGTGFHPELTGRENIYLNGAILGMRKKEITRKFDEIVAFAGVERYIDTPVKRYSSGMYVRLAFAVAAHLESEVLIVDEVLAVGDAEFQKKCLGKMNDVSKGEGRTVLFVSHNMNAIKNLCKKAVLLENGCLVLNAQINIVINRYMSSIVKKTYWQGTDGDNHIEIIKTWIKNKSPDFENGKLYTKDNLEISIELSVKQKLNDVVIGFNLLSNDFNPLLRAFYNDYNNLTEIDTGTYIVSFNLPSHFLSNGVYKVDFDIALPFVKKINSEKINLEFELESFDTKGNRYYLENQPFFNSIIRPDLKSKIIKV